ncbi:ricin-type beta-trefoil lectin domain protein [Kitasatospora sp. NPDC048365]|uniref:RICIN domain-containing protein n=1 Tax=Kitasatospora sp. NPDC048365 TaxID=3364050 RepID=UPI0037194E45
MTGNETGTGNETAGGDGLRGNAYHGETGVMHGNDNIQINLHGRPRRTPHRRPGILVGVGAVVLVCAATAAAVLADSGPGTVAAGPTTDRADSATPTPGGAVPTPGGGPAVTDAPSTAVTAPTDTPPATATPPGSPPPGTAGGATWGAAPTGPVTRTSGSTGGGSGGTGRTPAPGTAQPSPPATEPPVSGRHLVNRSSSLCLRVAGLDAGLTPVQDSCTGAADRAWTLDPETRAVRNTASGRCLTAGGTGDWIPTRQEDCGPGATGQRWEQMWGSGERLGYFQLFSNYSNKCLVVQDPAAGRPAAQVSCGDAYPDQWWQLV